MRNRPLISTAVSVATGVILLIAGTSGLAATLADPFSTQQLLTPPPSLKTDDTAQLQPCSVPANTALALAEVVDAALCRNPQTREVWANARAQAASVGVAQSAWLPTLDGTLSANRQTNRGGTLPASTTNNQQNATLALSWLIYDFGGREASIANARELFNAASATQDATVQTVFLAAVQAYFQLQAAQAASASTSAAEKAAQESFNAAEARYKAGAATPADKLQAQTAKSQATLNRIKAEGSVNNATGALANIMGLSAATPLQLAAPGSEAGDGAVAFAVPATTLSSVEASATTLIDTALQRRPDLRAARAQTSAAQAAVDVARASGRPSIALGINGGETHSNLPDARSAAIGVTMKIPLFAGFSTSYKIRAAEAQADATQARSEQLQLQVALDVWNSYQALTTATQTLQSTADLLASAEESQRLALGRYKAGIGSILDVLNAQSALASAQQQRVQSQYDWNVARVALAQAMGSLDRNLIDTLDQPAAGQSAAGAIENTVKNTAERTKGTTTP